MGILIEIALTLLIALGSMDLLTILFQSMNIGYFSISLNHFEFPSSMFYSFHSVDLSPPYISLFLGILFFLMQFEMILFSCFPFLIVHY